MSNYLIPVSAGELLDKITILEIKAERIADAAKLDNVRRELQLLDEVRRREGLDRDAVDAVTAELRAINERLWEIEDEIRDKEAHGAFDEAFIELARAVYVTNDQRAALKRRINELTGSALVEEKSYRDYGRQN